MSIQMIIRLAIAAAIFGTAWQIQDWRYGAKEAANDKANYEAIIESQRLAFRAKTVNDERVIAAQNAATLRENTLRNDAAGSRTALVRLSHAADAALSRAAENHTACVVTATAQNLVLKASSERYRELGEVCDRHVSDIQKLSDSGYEK